MLDGARWREDRAYERAAWMVAYLLHPYQKPGSEPIQPRDLLHPRAADPEESLDAALAKQARLRAAGQAEPD